MTEDEKDRELLKAVDDYLAKTEALDEREGSPEEYRQASIEFKKRAQRIDPVQGASGVR